MLSVAFRVADIVIDVNYTGQAAEDKKPEERLQQAMAILQVVRKNDSRE